jgi:cobalamin biosynthesis protein CobD
VAPGIRSVAPVLESWVIVLLIVSASFAADLLGEPPLRIHPVVLIGRMASFLDRKLRFTDRLRAAGVLLWVLCVVVPVALSAFLLRVLYSLGFVLVWFLVSVFLLKSSFTLFSMDRHVKPILESLRSGEIDDARRHLQLIVRRPTADLDTGLICSAVVESVAEGLVDGTCSPLLFFSVLGVLGALGYRAVNTLDSMVGYTSPEYLEIGWFSAKADTAANYLTARLVGILTVIAAYILGLNARGSWVTFRRDHSRTRSRNAGCPMAAFAGALNVRLEKRSEYVIGEGYGYPGIREVEASLKLMKLVTLLFTALVAITFSLLMAGRYLRWWL